MTTLAALCMAKPPGDNNSYPYLAIWDDEQLLWMRQLPTNHPQHWTLSNQTAITISSDGRYVCLSRMYHQPETARIYSVEDGTYESIPELSCRAIFGPSHNIVTWSPQKKVFVSGFGDYAYDPESKVVTPLPGPSEAAKLGSEGFTVLPGLGMIFECMNVDSTLNPMDYRLVARDLFTGEEVEAPDRVNGLPYSGRRPAAWHDDTGIQGMIYNALDYSRLFAPYGYLQSQTRIISSLNWELLLPESYMMPVVQLYIGCLFRRFGSSNLEYTGTIATDEGMTKYKDGLDYSSSYLRHNSISFEYKNFGFNTSEHIVNVGSDSAPTAINLDGLALPGAPPLFTLSEAPWEGFTNILLTQVASPIIYRDPVVPDGKFWSKLRYAAETRA